MTVCARAKVTGKFMKTTDDIIVASMKIAAVANLEREVFSDLPG